jgi:hypothetical protein
VSSTKLYTDKSILQNKKTLKDTRPYLSTIKKSIALERIKPE